MNKIIILLFILGLIVSCNEDKEVLIDDSELRICLKHALKISNEEKIYQSDADTLSYLMCSGNIKNVTGIDSFKNLEYLEIQGAYAERDFTEIGNLKMLKTLILYHYRKSCSFLSDMKTLDTLSLFPTYLKDLSCIEDLNLKTLEIDVQGKILDNMLNSIGKVISLEKLFLSHNEITNLNFLINLTNLKNLDLFDNSITDLEPLNRLVNLEELDISSNDVPLNLSPLANLLKLNKLFLAGSKITDISALKDLTNMKVLHLYSNNISDIKALQYMSKLHELIIMRNNIVIIEPLKNLTSLNYLDLSLNKIKDLAPLTKLTNLEYLNLVSNREASGENAIKYLVKLKKLKIRFTGIKTFNFLKNLVGIKEVSFEGNKVDSLEGIENIPENIKMINLASNRITDLSPFSKLTQEEDNYIWYLILDSNYITDLSPLSNLKIHDLYVSDNCITDFLPVDVDDIYDVHGADINNQKNECKIPDSN